MIQYAVVIITSVFYELFVSVNMVYVVKNTYDLCVNIIDILKLICYIEDVLNQNKQHKNKKEVV